MKDFYKKENKSEIDFQKTIKNRGFSFLNMDVQDGETIVEVGEAQ